LITVGRVKERRQGERVTFRAQALRVWEVGGQRMCLVGDESGLMRVEVGAAVLEEGASYEFRDALVEEYPGGWHSVSIANGGQVVRLAENVPVSQQPEYIERTFKILSGVQRKRARREGRLPAWRHPASAEASKESE
jgi:hypothetical protein